MAAESTVRVIFLGDSAQAVRSVSRLEGSFASLGRTTKLIAGALGVALVGGLAVATKAAIDFQKQMELIHTQAGASAKEVEKMSKAVLGLAASVGTGPEDLAKGLFHIESAGIRGAHALEILRAAAEGAKVGHADLEGTVNALIGAFKSGVKGAGSMEHAMAVLNATVGAGNMRMSDLTAALGTGLLSAAKGVGISFQDVGAALAELTVQNENASEASTRLQMAFLTMAAGTKKGDAALKSIGISQFKLATDMRSNGLIFALQDLQNHLQASGRTATEQTAIIADVFGRRSLKAILPLLQHLDDVRKRQEQINATTGDFGKAWVATQQTVDFQLARAKAALQAAFIPIGTLMLPLVTRLAQGVTAAAELITRHMGQIQSAAHQAAVVIGDAWRRYAIPAIQAGQRVAQELVAFIVAHWPQIRSTAESVGSSIRSVFNSIRSIIQALMPVIQQLAPVFKLAFGAALVVIRVFAQVVAAAMRETAFEVKLIAPVFRVAFAAVASIVSAAGGAIMGVIQGIEAAIHGLLDALHALESAAHAVGSFAAGKGSPGSGSNRGGGGRGVPGHAAGGFVAGQEGAPVPILAHAGEVVLNRSQQAALGGVTFFQRMFGFTGSEGPGFATGGIVNAPRRRKPGTSHHRPRQPRYQARNALARRALKGVDAINQTESDDDRAYGQLVRQYQIADTDVQFIRYDAQGNPYVSQPDIAQRVGEIDSLIAARNHMLDLLAEEKKKLQKAIEDLKRAIAAMLQAIKTERKTIQTLARRLADEKRKKHPNQGVVNSLQNQITAGGTTIGNLTSTISGFQQAVGTSQLNLNHQLPFDVRDVQLDIAELQEEREDDTGTTLPPGGGGGGGLGSGVGFGGLPPALVAAIQTIQQSLIGSFAKGTLSVPETGLALVHAGEQIVPAGQVRGGDGAYSQPIQVSINLSGPLEPLAHFITATVDTPQMADRMSVRIGKVADARARSGRF